MKITLVAARETLAQLDAILAAIPDQAYSQPLPVFSGSSMGQHVRHILEFYQCLLQGLATGLINYDARRRNPLLETDRAASRKALANVLAELSGLENDLPLQLAVRYRPDCEEELATTLWRELVYNVEHATHHMAMLRIGLTSAFPEVVVASHFGFAHSTRNHQAGTVIVSS